MEKKTTIGVLGATGNTGRGAVEAILASPGFAVVPGGRNPDQLRAAYPHLASGIEPMYADAFDRESLRRFCGSCEVVVNCAGPSKLIADRVAEAAIGQGVHYVDVSGDEQLYRQLLARKREIEDKRLSVIVSAGAYPGLSEIFPAAAARTHLDEVDSLEMHFAGSGGFSLNAAYDIVCSIQEDASLGMTYCADGEARKLDRPVQRTCKLPPPAGERDAYPILHYEFLSAARAYGFRSAIFYNTYPDKSVLSKLVMIKALEQYKTEEQKRSSAKMLAEHYAGGAGGEPAAAEYTMLHMTAAGRRSGRPLRLVSHLLYQGDGSTLSGIVAGFAARLIVEADRKKTGCYLAAEGIEPLRMIDALGGLGERKIQIAHTMAETSAEVNDERG